MEGEDSNTNLRVASFSCYLNTPEESNMHKLVGEFSSPPESPFPMRTKNLAAIKPTSNSMYKEDSISNLRVCSFSSLRNTPGNNSYPAATISTLEAPYPISVGRAYTKEGEISIFGADKYFNMNLEDESRTKYEQQKKGGEDLHPMKPSFNLGTLPSIVSESNSSLNSQTAFLPNLRRNSSQTRERRALGKKLFPSFGCSGACSDKKEVYISVDHAALHATKQSIPELRTEEQLSFPILDSGIGNLSFRKQFELQKELEDQRKSLEVFGSEKTKKGDIAANLARKLSMLTWDAIPKSQNHETTSFGSNTMFDDMASDASSDLFEIENFSGTGTGTGTDGFSFLTMQEPDNMSSCMRPTTHYAPSEASIEWSVVTASAADFSAVSDFESISVHGDMVSKPAAIKAVKNKNMEAKFAQKNRPGGGLLGCRTLKSVRVAEPVVQKISEKTKQQVLDLDSNSFSFRNLQAESRVKNVDFP